MAITAQSAALVDARVAIDILTREMTASVNLVKALGGGWSIADLPYGGVPAAGQTSESESSQSADAPKPETHRPE